MILASLFCLKISVIYPKNYYIHLHVFFYSNSKAGWNETEMDERIKKESMRKIMNLKE